MIGAAAAYMSGLFFVSFFTEGSDLLLAAGVLPVFFILAFLIKLKISDTVIISVFFASACCAGAYQNHFEYDRITAYSGTVGTFRGEAEKITFYDNDRTQYILDGMINSSQPAKLLFYSAPYDIEAGDIMALESCEFSTIESDYMFDSADYYKSKEIYLTADSAEISVIEHTDGNTLVRFLDSYREKMMYEFNRVLGSERGSFLTGLVFGETSDFDDNSETLMYHCGIGHILAVSGLHISIIAAVLMKLMRRLRIGKFISFAVINVFFVLMIIIVQYPVSAIRAAIMLDFMYSARLFRRQNDSFNALSAAVLLICLSNPYVIHDPGFLLSVIGTFGIAVFAPYMTKNLNAGKLWKKPLKSMLEMLCVTLAITPMTILYFDEFSLVSPFTNVFIVPITAVILVIGIVYVLTGGLISLLSPAGILIDIVMKTSEWFGGLSFSHLPCGTGNTFLIAALCAVFVLLTAAVLRRRRYIALSIAGAVTVFTLSMVISALRFHDEFRIAVLGSGNNMAAVITYSGRTDVIDLSGNYKSARYVRKYLMQNGIAEIESLTLTKKCNSQFIAYDNAFALIDADSIFLSRKVNVSAQKLKNTEVYGGRDISLINEDYSLKITGGALEITCGGRDIIIQPAKESGSFYADLAVYYGNIPKSAEIIPDGRSIYLDETDGILYEYSGMNNFEIILSAEGGELEIRRL